MYLSQAGAQIKLWCSLTDIVWWCTPSSCKPPCASPTPATSDSTSDDTVGALALGTAVGTAAPDLDSSSSESWSSCPAWGCIIPIIGGAPWKSHLHHLRYHLTGKHRRHYPQHVVGRSTTSLIVDPVHHRHAATCTVSERYDLPQQTSEKTNGCRDSVTVIATLITAMHACHRMFLHFLTFFMLRDISSFEFLDLPILLPLLLTYPSRFFEIFWFFFCCFRFVFCICLYCFFYQLSFFCTPPCPFTCRHPLALAFFPFSIHRPLCWGSINTATFWRIHHRSSMVSHVTFGHVNSTKNDSRHQKVCKHVDYERISTWQCHDNYGGLNLVLCPAHEHAITSIYFWATKHIISLFKPSTISLSQTFYTKTLVEMIKFYRLNHPLFIYIYLAKVCPTCFHDFLRYKT